MKCETNCKKGAKQNAKKALLSFPTCYYQSSPSPLNCFLIGPYPFLLQNTKLRQHRNTVQEASCFSHYVGRQPHLEASLTMKPPQRQCKETPTTLLQLPQKLIWTRLTGAVSAGGGCFGASAASVSFFGGLRGPGGEFLSPLPDLSLPDLSFPLPCPAGTAGGWPADVALRPAAAGGGSTTAVRGDSASFSPALPEEELVALVCRGDVPGAPALSASPRSVVFPAPAGFSGTSAMQPHPQSITDLSFLLFSLFFPLIFLQAFLTLPVMKDGHLLQLLLASHLWWQASPMAKFYPLSFPRLCLAFQL
jgi:hypothetical protein